MGSGRWDPGAWDTHATKTQSKSTQQIFKSTTIKDALNPLNIEKRESCDTAGKGDSNPIIIMSDVTGSMDHLADAIIRTELGKIMKEIYDRQPVSDPHILIGATGDSRCDQAPLQVTQFETDMKLADQMVDIWLEKNGGGNGGESYNLAWYFAAYLTSCDAITKRGRKGYLFTIGDELPHLSLSRNEIERVFGHKVEADLSSADLYAAASQNWHVFHLCVGSDGRRDTQTKPDPRAMKAWRDLVAEHVLPVDDYTKMGEIIVSTIQVIEGEDAAAVASSWSGATALVVQNAVGALTKAGAAAGVVRM